MDRVCEAVAQHTAWPTEQLPDELLPSGVLTLATADHQEHEPAGPGSSGPEQDSARWASQPSAQAGVLGPEPGSQRPNPSLSGTDDHDGTATEAKAHALVIAAQKQAESALQQRHQQEVRHACAQEQELATPSARQPTSDASGAAATSNTQAPDLAGPAGRKKAVKLQGLSVGKLIVQSQLKHVSQGDRTQDVHHHSTKLVRTEDKLKRQSIRTLVAHYVTVSGAGDAGHSPEANEPAPAAEPGPAVRKPRLCACYGEHTPCASPSC